VIDITDPASPQIVGGVDTPGHAFALAVSETHAYVADGFYGLKVIDIADPANPQIVGNAPTPAFATGLAVSETYAYLGSRNSDSDYFQVIDITDPANPWTVGGADSPGSTWGVAVSETHAYVADGSSGLVILPAQCATASVGDESRGHAPLRVHPNPGRGRASIELATGGRGEVAVGLYDIAGRRLRRIYAGSLPAGRHDLLWDGLDESRRAVAAGTYFIRVLTPEGNAAARLVVIR
jgi:hypothetical protein